MDVWAPDLLPAVWMVVSLLSVCCHEVTVRDSDLKRCDDDNRVCVTDLRDCSPAPPASIHKTLNMSCSYQESLRSMTCGWSGDANGHTEPGVSLIFSSEDKIISCQGIFNPVAVLYVTARIKNYMMETEIWSRPHTVVVSDAIKPSQPVLAVLGSTEDSVVVSWTSSGDGGCRLRYRVDNAHTWTQAPDSVPAHQNQTVNFTITDLLTFTVYRAAVACRKESGIWSDWSADVSARTLDRAPSRPPEVCYRVEKTDSGGSFLLHLMWKDLDLRDAGGRILGYQVSYEQVKKKQDRFVQNVTEVTALLVVEEGNCSVTVAAFNTAGYGPAARLSVAALRPDSLPSVRHLWVSSPFPATRGLLVQWENPTVPPSVPPVSHIAVQWRSEAPSSSRWTTVDSVTTSAVIQDVDPDESYLISVIPVYSQRCGSPQSLPASLQHGALMEAVQLKVVGVTKTTVNVAWAWQRRAGPIRVNRYSMRLRKDSERQTQSLWPDQWQLTFLNLNPNTEYSLLLLADNVSRSIIPVRTDFDEVPAVAAATPLLLLAVTVFIISILSRTLYRSYFFPPISSPRGSTTGQWLMDSNHQKTAERNILDMEDFQVTDVLGEKSLIMVGPNSQPSEEEEEEEEEAKEEKEKEEKELHEDASLLSMGQLTGLSALEVDPEYISVAPVIPEHLLDSLPSYHADYRVNCRHPDFSEEGGDAALLRRTHEANGCFPPDEERRQVNPSDLMANSHCVHQMTCEVEYVATSSFLEKTVV